MKMSWRFGVALLASAALPVGCDRDLPAEGFGELTLALESEAAAWFRLQVFRGPLGANLSGDELFDTGCVEARSRTYELTNIPVGEGRAVLFQGFAGAGCEAAQRVEVGYRGAITITQGQRPYYHVPIYREGALTALPEELNLSASTAEQVEFCALDAECGPSAVCYDLTAPEYWCVPTCGADADCAAIHARGTCDVAAGWCMLMNPFPLNLSEPRAFGAAVPLSNGDVAFVGGFGAQEGDALTPTRHLVEVFDHATGLFAARSAGDVDAWAGGLFGVAQLPGDRVVLAGGATSLSVRWNDAHGVLGLASEAWGEVVSDALVVVNPRTGAGARSALPRAVAQPLVVALGDATVLVAGGISAEAGAPSRDAWICEIAADLTATCEGIAPLQKARIGAAGACLDPACGRVLVLGGADGPPLIEILERQADPPAFVAVSVAGLPGRIWDPALCGLDLVAGSTTLGGPAALAAQSLSVDGDSVTASPIPGVAAPYLPAVARAGDRCYTAGGLGEAGEILRAVTRVAGGAGATGPEWNLMRGRFGAAGAPVGAGALAGKVLFGGGLTVPDRGTGTLALVRGVEVLSP